MLPRRPLWKVEDVRHLVFRFQRLQSLSAVGSVEFGRMQALEVDVVSTTGRCGEAKGEDETCFFNMYEDNMGNPQTHACKWCFFLLGFF